MCFRVTGSGLDSRPFQDISHHLVFSVVLVVFLTARSMFRLRLRSHARRTVIFFAADVARGARTLSEGLAPVIFIPREMSLGRALSG